jgi:hypothetical protein
MDVEDFLLEKLQKSWEQAELAGHDLVAAYRAGDAVAINESLRQFQVAHRSMLRVMREAIETLQQQSEQINSTSNSPLPRRSDAAPQSDIVAAQAAIVVAMMLMVIFVIGSLIIGFWPYR